MTPTLRFYDRPEGWAAKFELGTRRIETAACVTEQDAINVLNENLGKLGLMRYRVKGKV